MAKKAKKAKAKNVKVAARSAAARKKQEPKKKPGRVASAAKVAAGVALLAMDEVLYPALKPHSEAHDIVLESVQEHHVADTIVKELHEVDKDDEQWGAKFKVLKESVEHHIGEEEEQDVPDRPQRAPERGVIGLLLP